MLETPVFKESKNAASGNIRHRPVADSVNIDWKDLQWLPKELLLPFLRNNASQQSAMEYSIPTHHAGQLVVLR